ncbi:iron ABC transporter permease [Paenibacillus sp. YPG26]|uniref:FecCD family ABC transporter permease n=1 Tax=Paenibacillus sp. YPG26 TaxID=2878915 RepID=UPI00203BCF82|nr:iron ABC transporter permease [Paenibacillus sp. YPG26]USB31903.1 iron ABC transporter permease [Paenibacillus sp. YPG26]
MSASPREPEFNKIRESSRPLTAVVIMIAGLILLGILTGISIATGSSSISLSTVWQAVIHFNPDLQQHQVIRELRIPRALAGVLVGACLAVAGALMQGLTRNPLADSGLLGLNAGAGFAIAICFAFVPSVGSTGLMLFSFAGAAIAVGIVYGIGSLTRGGITPIRLTLAGAAVSALFVALSTGIAVYFNLGLELSFWYSGGLGGTKWTQLDMVFPWAVLALAGALLLSRPVTLLNLGEEVASGLGLRTGWVKAACLLVVMVLAGASVSVAGMIAFVGLIVPHLARSLVGVDYRLIIPCSAVMGSLLVVSADIAGQWLDPNYGIPLGAVIALLGVPFFIFFIRRSGRGLI